MTVDMLIDWFATIGNFPVLAFILAVESQVFLCF